MGRKDRNPIKRIEQENLQHICKSARRQRERLLITSLEEIPGTLIEHVEEVHSQPPSVEEWAALNDILECSSCEWYFTEIATITNDAYLTDEEKLAALDDLEDKILTLAAPFLAVATTIKTNKEKLTND
ncbi:hypothetical protein MUU49_20805 [Scandinavium goeteborgense]|uniref:hypothetical protein n=1 Tax=Scandinavium goeteborgense TaxID=1851514 RepID=UPI00216611EE|nr:hypothetical protein [Scandinavium goeteborgense]MCS2154993.1 hypothetical protein [Scandinavium goeteborgense]